MSMMNSDVAYVSIVDLISGGREDDTVNGIVKQVMSICGGSSLYIPGRS